MQNKKTHKEYALRWRRMRVGRYCTKDDSRHEVHSLIGMQLRGWVAVGDGV
jgi:hypothetical protein